jgi:dTDP-4-dehydrorhamnose reductase
MEKILITGISGFLGWNLARALRSLYGIYGAYLDHQVFIPSVETLAFDFADLPKIEKFVNVLQPQAIVHTAALSRPDFCEAHRKETVTVNTLATKEIARVASRMGSKLIYISTDMVFDGEKGNYTEADTPAPINYYGKTKYLGELEVTNHSSYYAILRLSLLYGRGNGMRLNHFETLERSAKQSTRMSLFVDQYRTPLFIDDVVATVVRLLADKSLKGLFHLGGPEKMSRYQFGKVFQQLVRSPSDLLVEDSLANATFLAPRPKDCSLRSDKLVKATGIALTGVEAGLTRLLSNGARNEPLRRNNCAS